MANATSGNGIAAQPADAVARLIDMMSARAELDSDGPNSVTAENIADIMRAQTEDEMWDADERTPIGGRDLDGIIQEITGFDVKFSAGSSADDEIMNSIFVDNQGRKMYVLVNAVRLSKPPTKGDKVPVKAGETLTWNTSAPRLVSKLFWLQLHDRFPARVVIQAVKLPGDRQVLKLRPAPSSVTVISSATA